jgi:tRNA (guanosine-2'-O-)-methyltransferase
MKNKLEAIAAIETLLLDSRKQLIRNQLNQRTYHIDLILEDMFQKHNASAVIRSADCFGLLKISAIERRNKFIPELAVARGADKWLEINTIQDKDSDIFINKIKSEGRKIVVTQPDAQGFKPENLPLHEPISLVFGTERRGVSEAIIQQADYFCAIPMYGFTESLNVSVSCGIILSVLSNRLRTENIHWQLNENQKTDLHYNWLMKNVRDAEEALKFHRIEME